MADHAGDGNDIFVYMGGLIPEHLRETITHVRIHKSVKIIRRHAFLQCRRLLSIEMHNGVEIIEQQAFWRCESLRRINLSGVRIIEQYAFNYCAALVDVEFGEKLESIGQYAFCYCTSLRNIKLTKVRFIRLYAFHRCKQLTYVKFSEDLETIENEAFDECPHLRRIAIPLKIDLLHLHVFYGCDNLSQLDIVGGVHKTISSLLLDSWRNEMNNEIDSINRDLPNTPGYRKTSVIGQWMETVIRRIEHYKSVHFALLKEFTTLLELALWKAKLDESQDESSLGSGHHPAKKVKIDMKAARQERRITSGANIVIKNVLPFLKLE